MTRIFSKAALAVFATLALGGAAQATQINIAISVKDRGAPKVVRYGGFDGAPRSISSPWDHDHGYRHPDRFYGRPMPEHGYRHPDRFYGRPVPEHGFWDRPAWARAAFGRPHEHHDDCRTIIKKTVSPWRTTVKHVKICE